MNLLQRLRTPKPTETRQGLVQLVQTLTSDPIEPIAANFQSFVQRGYLDNGIIYACVTARVVLFSQIRFQIRNRITGETRRLPPRMRLLEEPWPNGTTAELLAKMEQDVSLAGNAYIYKALPDRLQRLRPDWVDISLTPNGSDIAGYVYHPGGRQSGQNRVIIWPEEMAHFSPYPDPMAAFRGASWISSIVRETVADHAMTRHKNKYFTNAATPNMLVTVDKLLDPEARKLLRAALDRDYGGWENAYRTMVLEAGADAKVIGSDMQQLAFEAVQAAGENRIAVAARVPSVVLGIKEGAAQATYNNYGQAMRAFADHTMRHLWITVAGTLQRIVTPPEGWELWFDDTKIPALQADAESEAKIRQIQAGSIRTLIDGGFDPQSVVDAVVAGDLSMLEHTGALSVQLQEPGEGDENDDETPQIADNGDQDERFARIVEAFGDDA